MIFDSSLYDRKSSTVWIWAQINIVSLLWGTQCDCGPWAEYFHKPGSRQAGDVERFLLWRMSYSSSKTRCSLQNWESKGLSMFLRLGWSYFQQRSTYCLFHLAFLINRSMPFSNLFLLKYLLKTKHLKRSSVLQILIHSMSLFFEAKCIWQ